MLISQGLASESGLNKGAFAEAVNADQFQRIKWAQTMGIANAHEATPEAIADVMAKKFAQYLREDAEHAQLNTAEAALRGLSPFHPTPKDTGKKGDIHVTIQRIEVTSDDPDRFAFGLDELVQTAASRRGLTPGYTPPAWRGAF